jgi:uncharacterized DUF497 family protein
MSEKQVVITWDERKALANIRKHAVSFELAQEVFEDDFQVRLHRGVEHGEERWWTIGLVGAKTLLVVHTWIENEEDEIIRIISARKATASERRRYEEG